MLTALWTFLWFVCFCLLANQWAKTTDTSGIPTDAAQAIIAFSFFSVAAWVSLSFSMSDNTVNVSIVMTRLLSTKSTMLHYWGGHAYSDFICLTYTVQCKSLGTLSLFLVQTLTKY